MPLDPNKLKSNLENDVFTINSGDPHEGAVAWANAYIDYAMDAQTCQSAVPNFIGKEIFIAALEAAFLSGLDPATTAAQIATAFSLLWTPVGVTFTPPGVAAVLPPVVALLQSALLTLWLAGSTNPLNNIQAAAAHAPILHTFTLGVVVAHATIPICALSII